MSNNYYKTKYNVEGAYGIYEEKTLYCWQANTSGTTLFYDENFQCILCFGEEQNNIFDAMNKLYAPDDNDKTVECMSKEEIEKIKR